MDKVKEILNRLFEWAKKWKWWILHTIIILIMLAIAVWGLRDAYTEMPNFIGKNKPITLEYLVGFFVTITTIYIFVWRVRYQEKQINIQIKKEVDDRFTTAVNLLGSSETSARTGAIYSLYQQAVDDEKYRVQIVQILCSHIRSKTQEPEYQKQHKKRPSNEIQTTIDLLFRNEENTGLYPRFRKTFPSTNLSYAYCAGADFERAYCQEANFREANFEGAIFEKARCQGAVFRRANCQKAEFRNAYCQVANFVGTNCQGADFVGADCQRAIFIGADCQRAIFVLAHCQGASFKVANCQGTNFMDAHCQEASFMVADCQGAGFRKAHCEGACFRGAGCQGTNFWNTHCQGADFGSANCEGADFRGADCQGANFWTTHCQGTDFNGAHCQGAYNSERIQFLAERIGKHTELEPVMILEGELSEPSAESIKKYIEKAKKYCSPPWYSKMKGMIENNNGKEAKYGIPDGIISGVLEDSEELQKIIKELEKINKAKIKDLHLMAHDIIARNDKI